MRGGLVDAASWVITLAIVLASLAALWLAAALVLGLSPISAGVSVAGGVMVGMGASWLIRRLK